VKAKYKLLLRNGRYDRTQSSKLKLIYVTNSKETTNTLINLNICITPTCVWTKHDLKQKC